MRQPIVMRWTWKLIVAAVCLVLAVDLIIAYGWYRERRAVRRAGFTARTYVDDGGGKHGYVVFVPYELADGERPPLLVFLNGRGQNGDDGVRQISNNFGRPVWEMQQRFPFVCVAPQCSENGTWSGDSPDTRAALAIVDEVIEEYQIDPDRVYLTGVSSGGGGVWNIAAAYPEKFAALVPLAGATGGRPVEEAADVYAAANLPIWNFYNSGDAEGLVAFNRDLRQALIDRGLSPVFVEYDKQGHNCWEWAYRTPAMYDWLSRQDRIRNANISKYEVLRFDTSLSGWQADSAESWLVEDGVLRVNPETEPDTSSTLMNESVVEDFELHFEYRSDEGRTFEIVIQNASQTAEELCVVIAWPEQGTGGVVLSESGEWLSGTDPLAQQTLNRGFWNDVRLQRAGRHVSVRVNGLPLADVPDTGLSGPCRFGFRVESATSDGRWRFLRTRPLLPSPPQSTSPTEHVHAGGEGPGVRGPGQAVRTSTTPPPTPPTPRDILSAWNERSVRAHLEWRQDTSAGIHRFSRFAGPDTSDQLDVNEDRFRYEGARRPIGEHGYQTGEVGGATFTLSEMFPERQQDPFERALASRFKESGHEPAALQSFIRIDDGTAVRDFWAPGRDAYPRGAIHHLPEAGSPDWALLSLDEPGHELETLDLCAALLAVHPGHRLFGADEGDCRVERSPVLMRGTDCWKMSELTEEDSEVTRTFCVDPQRGFVVRRFQGASPERIVQIDIDYSLSESTGWMPERWTVVLRSADQAPIQQFVRSHVTKSEPAQPLTEQALAISYPVGTWVVDEPAGEQYLNQADGKKRVIQADEFRWLPTYSELTATGSGDVGTLIETKIRHRQFWRQAKWPMVSGIAALVAAILFKLIKRFQSRRTTEPAQAATA